MRSEKGEFPGAGRTVLARSNPPSVAYLRTITHAKPVSWTLVVSDPTRIYLWWGMVYSVSLAGPCQTAHYTVQEVDVADQARLLNKDRNIAVLPRNRRFHGYQTNKTPSVYERVARASRRGLESHFRHYSPMEGFIQASHIVNI
jgi:hypothetical protein